MSDHGFLDFDVDDLGFVIAECECGWCSGACPGEFDAMNDLMDHVAETP